MVMAVFWKAGSGGVDSVYRVVCRFYVSREIDYELCLKMRLKEFVVMVIRSAEGCGGLGGKRFAGVYELDISGLGWLNRLNFDSG